MAKKDRTGKRTRRSEFRKRVCDLGYYLIVTDTEKTEENYITGLKRSLPEDMQNRIAIKVRQTKTDKLVQTCKDLATEMPQYRERWILFDRDKVGNFDQIIDDADKEEINVAWSNPCIEIWFHSYFGNMPNCQDSTSCYKEFKRVFMQATGQEYDKSSDQIYNLLSRYGNEEEAIKSAENRWRQHRNDGGKKPSDMCPCTTMYQLVRKIKRE